MRSKRWVLLLVAAALAMTGCTPLSDISHPGDVLKSNRDPVQARLLLEGDKPYQASIVRPPGTGENFDGDLAGRRVDGKFYDHPVAQAQYALRLLNSYRINGDAEYLRIAKANVDRMLETATRFAGALFYPYPFDFALHGGEDIMKAPWYSGMAQGQALSALIRLHSETDDLRYAKAAEETLASFSIPRRDGKPWVSNVDSDGYLWFEEYASDEHPDFTFNGHGFAVYGLHEYYQYFSDPVALDLFQRGVATMRRYIEDIRRVGWVSAYCLTHETPSVSYHNVHIEMLYQIYSMTGDVYFATMADALLEDFPNPDNAGAGRISEGAYVALSYTHDGALEESKLKVDSSELVEFESRRKIRGFDGLWLQVSTGTLEGYWIPESDRAYIAGAALEKYTFDPVRRGFVQNEGLTAWQFGKTGEVSGSIPVASAQSDPILVRARSLVNGVTHYQIAAGDEEGYWVPESALKLEGMELRSSAD